MQLFKFVSDETLFSHHDSFLNGEVYLSRWSDFNDPMEGFFSYYLNRPSNTLAKDVIGEKGKYRVSCFSKSYSNYLLWSYYTHRHRGACLEFDIDAATLPAGALIRDIQYKKSIPDLDENQAFEDQAIDFLLTKFSHWKQEEEVRLLWKSPVVNPVQIGKLVSITFGVKHSDGDPGDQERQKIWKKIESQSLPITLYQAEIDASGALIGRRKFDRYSQNRFLVT